MARYKILKRRGEEKLMRECRLKRDYRDLREREYILKRESRE